MIGVVVWSGKDELLPDRAERVDHRLDTMPNYDLDDGDAAPVPRRKYTKTGNHRGEFNRKRGYVPMNERGGDG